MGEQDLNTQLLEFFKTLADEKRLKIIGLLAQREYSVEELATTLDLSVSTTSHHLSYLTHSGLTKARTEGHYYFYSLNFETIQNMAGELLHKENLPALSQDLNSGTYERKVMAAFTDREGKVIAFPEKEKKLLVILTYIVKSFEPGKQYTEKEVNEILLRFNKDTAFMRRSLVEYKLMAREGGGGSYWRL
jgi:predicted transcriptional regulator